MLRQADYSIPLPEDVVLVLFEFVSRFSETDKLSIEDKAERIALWHLCCTLESILVQPFQDDYLEILKAARSRLCQE